MKKRILVIVTFMTVLGLSHAVQTDGLRVSDEMAQLQKEIANPFLASNLRELGRFLVAENDDDEEDAQGIVEDEYDDEDVA